jgi:hypothetical protein
MEHRVQGNEGTMAVVRWLWNIENGVEQEQGSGNVIMRHQKVIEGHREEWMWLWSNGRNADKETRKYKCGYGVLRWE